MRGSVVAVSVGVIVGSLVAALCLRPATVTASGETGSPVRLSSNASPASSTARPATPVPKDPEVTVDVRGEWSWALRNLETSAVVGAGTLRNTTESMIKSWLAVDYLASRQSRLSADDEARLARMIRASDDHAAQTLYLRLGGDTSITRMIRTCGLRDTRVHPGWWSKTTMSAIDATLLGQCVVRGPGVSPQWRGKLLDLMRSVEPGDAFGIPEAPALAGERVAVKNGWTRHGTWWAVNCLAIWDRWVLAVLVHYPDQGDEHRHGAAVCESVAQQLFGRIDVGFAAQPATR
ncbi:class A beta-lactamase-related serine hydrolase [Amycolatopsis sp. OK19-0408]|uniref:Class A beta-lactamase-related serine hydrolase n=1 Tax=Amycolatopsis iheyensis TaxID=2945988 RepID=A0A9X2NFC7_9PSEU|nr:class A beta-lactamase-related serine hydrolase [Amycolatopsis iheyensis]MCR6487786.1 class A beta-lactamase-related serine hydrolase [Amycolatopsis iheyensis]